MFKGIVWSATLILLGFSVAAPKTGASSPQAWEESNKEIVSKCTQISQLKDAKTVGKIILFGDDVGYSGLIIKGRYPQPHMKKQQAQVLCLFNRKTRKASIGEM